MLFWISTHKSCYFWVRSAFQLVAFSLLIVTLVMTTKYYCPYWWLTINLLVAIHSVDLLSNSLDLISLAQRNITLLRYKFALDILSFCLSIYNQTYFVRSMLHRTEDE